MSFRSAKCAPALRMRSKLFVPADRQELFAKALGAGADAVCFDLEDGVRQEQKELARETLSTFLRSGVSDTATAPKILVRVNGCDTASLTEDIAASLWPGITALALPKVDNTEEILRVAEMLPSLEKERHFTAQVAILPTIESPQGMRHAHAIASAHERVMGLQLGFLDLLLPLGIDPHHARAQEHLRFALRMAAGEAGLPCFDGAFASIDDPSGFRRDAEAARNLGFSGKSCIHPCQISITHEVFSPTEEEIAQARKVIAASREAAARGRGVFSLDGRMIDEPVLRHASQVLAAAGIDGAHVT